MRWFSGWGESSVASCAHDPSRASMTSLTRQPIATFLVVGCAGSEPDPSLDPPSACAMDTVCDDGDLSTANDRWRDDGVCADEPIERPTGVCIASVTPNGVDCDVTARPDDAICDDQSVRG